MTLRGLVVGLGALALAGLAGCASGPFTSTAAVNAGGTPLDGPMWVLTSKTALGVDLGSVTVTALFEAGTLSGSGGCNRYTTTYEVSGSSLTVRAPFAGTLKACPPPETAVETAYLQRLPRVASYSIAGSTLTLSDSSGKALLSYNAVEPEKALLGEWNVLGYYTGNAIQSPVVDSHLTIDFAISTVSGSSGCNTFHGPYEADGNKIAVGPLATTRLACISDELNKQETDYLAALELASSFKGTSSGIDLLRSDGGIAVSLGRP
jgi:heat shock protein HslJ